MMGRDISGGHFRGLNSTASNGNNGNGTGLLSQLEYSRGLAIRAPSDIRVGIRPPSRNWIALIANDLPPGHVVQNTKVVDVPRSRQLTVLGFGREEASCCAVSIAVKFRMYLHLSHH